MWASVFNRRMAICIAIGFSSGLPLYFLTQLVPAWLRRADIDIATIGLFSLATFPYAYKFLWAPFLDRFVPPFLGRRRGWMLLTQLALMGLLAAFGRLDPRTDMDLIVVLVILTAFASASQDIVIDAYRRELLPDPELGIGNSFHVNAYRMSALVPGSLGLILADSVPWDVVHLVVGSFMGLGVITTLVIREAPRSGPPPPTLNAAIVQPFVDFFTRHDLRWAWAVLAFMVLYKLGDNMATALETVFFIDMGFSNTDIGAVAKVAKLWAVIIGGVVGGLAMIRIGIHKALWIFGLFQIVSILGYLALSIVGDNLTMLFVAVSLEYLGVGLGTVALTAFIAKLCSTSFTAVQISLLTSVAVVPRTFANATTGFIVNEVGYTMFFLICFLCAIPGMLMLLVVAPWNEEA
ncbi:MAG: AmpG family muropeptide MFS transporter [Gammaproteobacteria bacterium]